MSVAEVKRLPIVDYQNIPECLREIANMIEAGDMSIVPRNVIVLVSAKDDIHPIIYSFGHFNPINDVGIMQSAIHGILTCNKPFRPQMEKTK